MKVIQLKDKNFITCGTLNANSDLGGIPRWRNMAVKFDTAGNVIWSKVYDTLSRLTLLNQLQELKNGNIFMGGFIDTLHNYNISGPVKIRLYRIDKNGVLKWKKYIGSAYTYTDSESLRSMNPTSDGGFILAVNLAKSPSIPPRPYSITKIDSTGCDTLEAYCKWVEALGFSDLYQLRGFEMNVFPNPAKNVVNIKIETEQNQTFAIKLKDLEGRELQSKELRAGETLQLNTSDYAPGVYFITLIQGNDIIKNRKLVVLK